MHIRTQRLASAERDEKREEKRAQREATRQKRRPPADAENAEPQLRSGRAAPRGRLPPHAPSSSESSETSASSLASSILQHVQSLSAAPPPRAPLAPVNQNSVSFPQPTWVETGRHSCIHPCTDCVLILLARTFMAARARVAAPRLVHAEAPHWRAAAAGGAHCLLDTVSSPGKPRRLSWYGPCVAVPDLDARAHPSSERSAQDQPAGAAPSAAVAASTPSTPQQPWQGNPSEASRSTFLSF